MPISNCPRCGKAFNKVPGIKICRSCQINEDELFETVYEYLRENPGTAIPKISLDTEVPERKIVEWYRSGRLVAEDGTSWACIRCDKLINKGKMCPECAGEVLGNLDELPDGDEKTAAERSRDRVEHQIEFGHEAPGDKYRR